MNIYNYDPIDGQFISKSIADESPLEKGAHLIPAHATTIAPPAFDSQKETCVFGNNTWIVSEKQTTPEPEPESTDYTEQNMQSLWQAATRYEQTYISGSALGLLTIGVMAGSEIAKAIQVWLNTLWIGHYYPRKAEITRDAPISKEMLDFTLIGPMPYSIPELAKEVEGL